MGRPNLYADWGPEFEGAPDWCLQFARWLNYRMLDGDTRSIPAWVEDYNAANGDEGFALKPHSCYSIQSEPEFVRLRQALGLTLGGFTLAHDEVARQALFAGVAAGKPDHLKLYYRIRGLDAPPAAPAEADISSLDDDELNRHLLDAGLPALPTPKETTT